MTVIDGNARQLHVSFLDGRISVTLNKYQVEIPIEYIDTLINTLQGAKIMLGNQIPAALPAVQSEAPSPAPVSYTNHPGLRREPLQLKNHGTTRQRSRKRVGDALRQFMQENPGWYSESELLKIVQDQKMTDSDPKRALMISLGKQHDIFVSDGKSNWSLKENSSLPPEAPKGEESAPKENKRPPTGRPRGRPPKKSATADSEGSPRLERDSAKPYAVTKAKDIPEEVIPFAALSAPNFPDEEDELPEEDANEHNSGVVRRSKGPALAMGQTWEDSTPSRRAAIAEKLTKGNGK